MPDASTSAHEAAPSQTQSCPSAEPQDQHRWLHRMVGAWAFDGEMPSQPGQSFSGTETVRSLNGLWIVGEGGNAMPDGTSMDTLVMLGFDPAKEAFVGSFACSHSTHMWVYRGRLEEGGKRLVLATEGPSMEGDGLTAYEDIITLEDADHRTMSSRMRAKDGQWREVVSIRYRRLPA